jgi:uncharacterized SAM-dependent methyltransferase
MGTLELRHYKLCKLGGGKRDRTADLLHAMQALSQLSYTPVCARDKIIAETLHYANTLLQLCFGFND